MAKIGIPSKRFSEDKKKRFRKECSQIFVLELRCFRISVRLNRERKGIKYKGNDIKAVVIITIWETFTRMGRNRNSKFWV